MKRSSSIDAVRAVACAAVLCIHCKYQSFFTPFMDALCRFAVPFFLMVSGFFTYRSTVEESMAAARRHLRATVRLTVTGTLLYAVSNTLRQLRAGQGAFTWLDSLLSGTGVFRFFVFNRAIFLSSVMYYLFLLIYVYAIFVLLLKYNAVRKAEKCIPVLLGACVVLTEFVGTPWYYSGNFLLTGLPFFLLGHYFARQEKTWANAKYLVLPGAALTLVEAAFFQNDVYCYIGTLLLSIGLFLACMHQPQAPVWKPLVWFGRHCSVYVFLIHCAVRDHIDLFISPNLPVYAFFRPLLILAVSVLLSICIAFLHKKRIQHVKGAAA